MAVYVPPVIECPVCGSHGRMLHHDFRASLVYSCQECTHEWEVEAAEAPGQADSTVAHPRTPSRTERVQPRKL